MEVPRLGGGAPFLVTIRRHATARRMILRHYPPGGRQAGLVLTLPPRVSLAAAQKFLLTQRDWMARQVAASLNHVPTTPSVFPFAAGVVIPILGIDHKICLADASLVPQPSEKFRIGRIQARDGMIHIAAPPEFLSDLLTVYLKNRSRQELQSRTDAMLTRLAELRSDAAAFAKNPVKISIGDATTRWGSCSSRQNLRYNWRLIFAPPDLIDYVVAHEVAHLVEMNHSPRFWAVVERLIGDHRPHRAWLKANTKRLFSYGRPAG